MVKTGLKSFVDQEVILDRSKEFFGFDGIGLEVVYTTIDQANLASLRVVTKLGFRFLETRYDEKPEPYFAYILEKPASSPTVH